MNLIINYPTDKKGIDELNEKIAEFKAPLIFGIIKRLNILDKEKQELLRNY